jgi:hypothetical protein
MDKVLKTFHPAEIKTHGLISLWRRRWPLHTPRRPGNIYLIPTRHFLTGRFFTLPSFLIQNVISKIESLFAYPKNEEKSFFLEKKLGRGFAQTRATERHAGFAKWAAKLTTKWREIDEKMAQKLATKRSDLKKNYMYA